MSAEKKLPLLVSVPHGGLVIPPEVKDVCLLTQEDIIDDGDKGALKIYGPLKKRAAAHIEARVARAVVDVNRPEDDFGPDGVIKTHTIWLKRIWTERPTDDSVRSLLDKYWRPYHSTLTRLASSGEASLGVDCHTMVESAPPISAAPGTPRPMVCISNATGTCPDGWLKGLAASFEAAFEEKVGVNAPFKGGYTIRAHSTELPWVQVEISRTDALGAEEKAGRVLDALFEWCAKTF